MMKGCSGEDPMADNFFTPLGCVRALQVTAGFGEGWERSDFAHGFFHANGAMVEAEAKPRGRFVWVATTAGFDDREFHATKLADALAWAAAN